jgi:Filamin/ABP280 repeat
MKSWLSTAIAALAVAALAIAGFAVTVPSAAAAPSTVIDADSTHLINFQDVGFANNPDVFTIQARNSAGQNITSGGGTFTISVTSVPPVTVTVSPVQDNGNGTYTFSLTTSMATEVSIHVFLTDPPPQNSEILNSPYNVVIRAPTALNSTASGPGVSGGVWLSSRPAHFTIQAADALGNIPVGNSAFAATVLFGILRLPVQVTLVDNHDGTYTGTYNPPLPGRYDVSITLDGVAISSSPYHAVFRLL